MKYPIGGREPIKKTLGRALKKKMFKIRDHTHWSV